MLHAPIRGGAWFFVFWSLASLLWAVFVMLREPATLAAIWQTDAADGTVVRAVGLTYAGLGGALLACVELALVSVAVAASRWGRGRGRVLGHGVLIAWALLWLLNLVGLAWIDGAPVTIAQASVMSGLFACVVGRAFLARTGAGDASAVDVATIDAAAGDAAESSAPADAFVPCVPCEPGDTVEPRVPARPRRSPIAVAASLLHRTGRGATRALGRLAEPARRVVRTIRAAPRHPPTAAPSSK